LTTSYAPSEWQLRGLQFLVILESPNLLLRKAGLDDEQRKRTVGVDADEEEEIIDWAMVVGSRMAQDKANRTCEKCWHNYHGQDRCQVCTKEQPCYWKQKT
jgi:hypothetical protein